MDHKDQPRTSDANAVATKQFSQMSGGEKAKHIGKVILFFFSFGFAFPNIFSD